MFDFLRVRIFTISMIALICFISCSGLQIPEDKKQYIGDWQSSNVRLIITEDGYLHYIKIGAGNMRTTIDAPLSGFEGDDFSSGLGCITTKFVVSDPPKEEDGRWTMTVDGHKLMRVSPTPQSSNQIENVSTKDGIITEDDGKVKKETIEAQKMKFDSGNWTFSFELPKNHDFASKPLEREERNRKIHQMQYKSEDPKLLYKIWHIHLLSEKTDTGLLHSEIQQLFEGMKVTYFKSRTGSTEQQRSYFEIDYTSISGSGVVRAIVLDEDELLLMTHIGRKQYGKDFLQSLEVGASSK
jgi:hypothetical protein